MKIYLFGFLICFASSSSFAQTFFDEKTTLSMRVMHWKLMTMDSLVANLCKESMEFQKAFIKSNEAPEVKQEAVLMFSSCAYYLSLNETERSLLSEIESGQITNENSAEKLEVHRLEGEVNIRIKSFIKREGSD